MARRARSPKRGTTGGVSTPSDELANIAALIRKLPPSVDILKRTFSGSDVPPKSGQFFIRVCSLRQPASDLIGRIRLGSDNQAIRVDGDRCSRCAIAR